jgi:1-deoxy-D-xylulose-5-phosphate synthase
LADKDYGQLNRFKVEQSGEKVAVMALGDFYQRGEELSLKIKKELCFTPTLINPRFASGIDEQLLKALMKNHQLVITLEDGILDGGFGQKIATFYSDKEMKVKTYGLKKEFYDRYEPEVLLEQLGMTTDQIVEDIKKLL